MTYANSLGNGFHYDDTHSILQNHSVRSLANIPLYFLDSGTFSSEPAMAMYRPLLLVSYAVNYALEKTGTGVGYLLVNAILHALCAVAHTLVYYLKLLTLPFPLSVEHSFSLPPSVSPLSGAVIGSALLLLTVAPPRGARRFAFPLAIAACVVVILFGVHAWSRSSVAR